jgi:hypothetical protein
MGLHGCVGYIAVEVGLLEYLHGPLLPCFQVACLGRHYGWGHFSADV